MSTSRKKDDESIESKKKPAKPHASEPQGNLAEYLRGVKTEWTKVTWPTWPQIWGQTLVVLFMVTVISLGILVIDQLIHFITNLLVPH